MACKEERMASIREANSKGEASVTADQQKKLQEKLDKCKQDSQKVRALVTIATDQRGRDNGVVVPHDPAKSR